MIDLKALKTFVWVATLGSFRAAAVKLNATQPAISQRIAQLEATCGTRLLDRRARAAVPTAKGRVVLDYAQRLLRLHDEMLGAVARDAAMRGVLRLGVAESIVHTWLPRLIERVSRAHPELTLEIEVDVSPDLRTRLLAHEIDLAFLLGPLSAPAIRNLPLGRLGLAFLASPKLGLPRRAALARLAAHPIVTFARRTQPHVALSELFAAHGFSSVRLHASAALAPAIRLALDGIAIAVMPPAIVRDELKRRRLVRIETDLRLPDLAFVACWPIAPGTIVAEHVAGLAADTAASYAAAYGEAFP